MAPYSAETLDEIQDDPVRIRCYFWRVAMAARRRAKEKRRAVRAQAVYSSPVAFDEVADWDGVMSAKHEEDFANAILDNIDALVKSSVRKTAA
jgi:hypothetical protein